MNAVPFFVSERFFLFFKKRRVVTASADSLHHFLSIVLTIDVSLASSQVNLHFLNTRNHVDGILHGSLAMVTCHTFHLIDGSLVRMAMCFIFFFVTVMIVVMVMTVKYQGIDEQQCQDNQEYPVPNRQAVGAMTAFGNHAAHGKPILR